MCSVGFPSFGTIPLVLLLRRSKLGRAYLHHCTGNMLAARAGAANYIETGVRRVLWHPHHPFSLTKKCIVCKWRRTKLKWRLAQRVRRPRTRPCTWTQELANKDWPAANVFQGCADLSSRCKNEIACLTAVGTSSKRATSICHAGQISAASTLRIDKLVQTFLKYLGFLK